MEAYNTATVYEDLLSYVYTYTSDRYCCSVYPTNIEFDINIRNAIKITRLKLEERKV